MWSVRLFVSGYQEDLFERSYSIGTTTALHNYLLPLNVKLTTRSLAISGQLNRAWKSRMISFSKLFDILTCVCQSVSSVSCQMESDCHLTHRWGVSGSGGRAAATAPPHPSLRSILEQNHHGQSGNVYRINRIDLISHALFTIQRGVDELRAHSSLKKTIRNDRN